MPKPSHDTPKFTRREKEIMTWTAQGKNSLQISVLLTISEPAVKKHIKSARLKLNANNKTHAIALALTMGLITSVHPNPQQMDET